jgi:hypothetical protein
VKKVTTITVAHPQVDWTGRILDRLARALHTCGAPRQSCYMRNSLSRFDCAGRTCGSTRQRPTQLCAIPGNARAWTIFDVPAFLACLDPRGELRCVPLSGNACACTNMSENPREVCFGKCQAWKIKTTEFRHARTRVTAFPMRQTGLRFVAALQSANVAM